MTTNVPALTWDIGQFEFQRKLGNFVQNFQVNLPLNGYGIPLKLVNPIILAPHLLDCATTDDVPDHIVEEATMQIDIDDGMPLYEGTPIWERLDGERVEYYNMFKQYREAAYVGGNRSTSAIATQYNIVPRNLLALSKIYNWQLRCKAYDVWKRQDADRKRQLEIMKVEGKHARAAASMLDQGLEWLDKHPEQLDGKMALQMIQIAMKAERLSVGLNGDKPGSTEAGTTVNVHQTAIGGMDAAQAIEGTGQPSPSGSEADLSNLQSILHVLDKSGALDKVKIVDAEYTVVEE